MAVCECKSLNNTEQSRCCFACSSESVKSTALSLISIGLCHRSERKARLLPSPASDSHLATYFKPLFSHHRKATKQMIFTSKAILPLAGRDWELGGQETGKRKWGINNSLKLIMELQIIHFLCECQAVVCHLRTWQMAEMSWNRIWHRCLTSPSNPSLHSGNATMGWIWLPWQQTQK